MASNYCTRAERSLHPNQAGNNSGHFALLHLRLVRATFGKASRPGTSQRSLLPSCLPWCDTANPTVPRSRGSGIYLHPIPSGGPSSAAARSRANSIWCPVGFPLWLTDSGVCHIQALSRQNRCQNVPKSPKESGRLIASCSSSPLNLTIQMAGDSPLKTCSLGGKIKIKESQRSWKMFRTKLLWWPQQMEDTNTRAPERCCLLPGKRKIGGEVGEET